MKGITPVIAVILLLLMTISIVGFAFVWFNRVAEVATRGAEQQLESFQQNSAKRIVIDNIESANSKMTVRNRGTVAVPTGEIQLYTGGTPKSCGWGAVTSIPPGSLATCDWAVGPCVGGTVIKVTTPGSTDESTC